MYADPTRNPDQLPLHLDHIEAISLGNKGRGDRLLLATCNMSRQTGQTGGLSSTPALPWRRDSWTRDWLAGFDAPIPSHSTRRA
jgi:hypothetical protein